MNNPVWRITTACIIGVLVVGMGGCGKGAGDAGNPSAAMKRVTVANDTVGLTFTAFEVARERGYFAKHGIELGFLEVGGVQTIAALRSGAADIANPINIMIQADAAGGKPLVAFAAQVGQSGADFLVSNKAIERAQVTRTSPIEARVAALKGLKIGVSSIGSTTEVATRFILQQYGFDPSKDVTLVPLGSASALLAAMSNGSVDAIVFLAPTPQQGAAKGYGQVLISTNAGDIPALAGIPSSGYIATADYLKSNPATVQAFVDALAEGQAYMAEHPDYAASVIAKTLKSFDADVVASTMRDMIKTGALTTQPTISPKGIDAAIAYLKATDPKMGSVDASALFTNEFATKAVEKLKAAK
jgi:NitT/TauT family transport system substrate-binding protein